MKSFSTKKTYLLLPDIIKEAKQKEEREKENKENNQIHSQTSHPKIPVAKFLQSSLKPLELQEMLCSNKPQHSNISFRSNSLFDEDQFIKDELQTLKLKEQIRKCDTQLSLGRQRLSTNTQSREKQPIANPLCSRKSSHQSKLLKSSDKKSKSKSKPKGSRNLLKEIKANKKQNTLIVNNSCIQNRQILKDYDSSSRQEIEPVLNFLEQLKNTDKLIFDPEKFQRFLEGIKGNKEFHKALRTFVYSYFIQNELND